LKKETVEAAFGYLEKDVVDIVERRTFDPEHRDALGDWYREIVKTYPRLYVAGLLDTINQGALPGCGKQVFRDLGVDTSLVQALCVDDWSVYASYIEMQWFENKLKPLAFDLLYSPFVLVYRAGLQKAEERPTLYMLHRIGQSFVVVMEGKRLLYSDILLVSDESVDAEEEEKGEEAFTFDLELLDEESEVVPISDDDILDRFQEQMDDTLEEEDEEVLAELEYGLNLFEALKDSIYKYYKDDRYPKTFIEKVVVFESDELTPDFVRYVREEFYMEAVLQEIDMIDELARLVADEVRG
jgi:hypothetical protein